MQYYLVMAENKKSFIAYADWIDVFEELEDVEAGKLVKHIWRYVNDLNPEADNKIVKMCFIPIKAALKRDLIKYEKIRKKRSDAGKASADKRQQVLTSVECVQQTPTKSTVSDSVSDSVNEEKNKEVFNFRKSLLDLGIEKQIVSDWLKVRSKKRASNTETSFNRIEKQIEKSGISANECIKIAVEKDWKGFEAEWINNLQDEKNRTNHKKGFGSDTTQRTIERIANGFEQTSH